MLRLNEVTDEYVREIAGLATSDELADLGAELVNASLLIPAVQALQSAVERGSTVALAKLALVALQEGRFVDAATRARGALDRGEFSALIVLGNALEGLGERDQALSTFREAIDKGVIEGYVNLALLLEDSAEAEQILRAGALAGDDLALRNLGVVLLEQGRLEEAAETLRQSAGTQYRSWFDLGNCDVERGDINSAADAYTRGACLGDTRCHLPLADLAADILHDNTMAEEQYRAAIRRGDELAYFNFGLFLVSLGRVSEGARCFGIAGCLGQGEAWHELANLSKEAEDSDRVEQLLRLARRMGDLDAEFD
jgi:tetratricopeptide (TPR) repeat protein